MAKESKCLTCGKKLTQVGNRPKKYCNSTCRSVDWHRKMVIAKKKMADLVNPKSKKTGKLVMIEDLTNVSAGKTKDLTKPAPKSNFVINTGGSKADRLRRLRENK